MHPQLFERHCGNIRPIWYSVSPSIRKGIVFRARFDGNAKHISTVQSEDLGESVRYDVM